MSAVDLLPCPFCGAQQKSQVRPAAEGGFFAMVACYCDGFAARAYQKGTGPSAVAAIAEARAAEIDGA